MAEEIKKQDYNSINFKNKDVDKLKYRFNKKEIDNTSVKKVEIKKKTKTPIVKYTRVENDVNFNRDEKKYSKKDSLDYKKGFKEMENGSWDIMKKASKPQQEGREEARDRGFNTPVDYFKDYKKLLGLSKYQRREK